MSEPVPSLRPPPSARWRRIKGGAFASLAAAALGLGSLVVVLLVFSTLRSAMQIVPMHATANAGLALSQRSMTGWRGEGAFVTVSQVESGSVAEQMGIEPGSALLRVAGEAVANPGEVWATLSGRPLDGRGVEVEWVPPVDSLLGELRAEALPGRRGVFRILLDWLPAESVAAQAGLRVGDVLLAVDGHEVTGTRQAWQAMALAGRDSGAPVTLDLEREGSREAIVFPAVQSAELPMRSGLFSAFWEFVTRLDEPRYPEHAGIASALVGSLFVILLTGMVAFPLGVAGAVYLEEYASHGVFSESLRVLIANLAGIPSVVYGIIGLEVLARTANLGRSILAGALTLALLTLPVMIVASREALRAVPPWIREAAYGAGATPWQVIRHQVLPYALPGMLTGMILSLSRAIGEAAPLLLLGAFLFVTYIPSGLMDTFTVIPLQIFSWATKPQAGYDAIAAAAIVVLLAMLLLLNASAIVLRHRFERRW